MTTFHWAMISAGGTAVAYRFAMHVLGKAKAGSLLNTLFKVLGGGGPGEEGK